MKKDIEIQINHQGKRFWRCRAEATTLQPKAATVDEEIAQPDVKMRLRIHYTSRLDPVLANPSVYELKVLSRTVPGGTILACQQDLSGRYIDLSI